MRILCFLPYLGFPLYVIFLQYFDTVGWVFSPVKTVSHITYITYTVLAGMLNHSQSNPSNPEQVCLEEAINVVNDFADFTSSRR